MKVITANPVYINKNKASDSSKYIPADGIIEYISPSAMTTARNAVDEDNFYPADGLVDGDSMDGEDLMFACGMSNASGKSRRKRRQETQDRRLAMRESRTSSKADTRKTKAQSKLEKSIADQKMADSLGKTVAGDVALADALGKTAPKTKKGMSTGAKIGIALGVLAVLGAVGYFVYKAAKKK
jgi:hypothetical protein